MRRGLLILLGLLLVTWFEFQVYPGHTFLRGETQLLVPMLERLDTPGFLTRDLVASNPTFAYTIYDELTEFLHAQAYLTFKQALLDQQLVFRFAGILGVFLLARSLKAGPFASVALSAAVNAITWLKAPNAYVTNPEATPAAFAVPLVFLAAGSLLRRMPLLASVAAGLALLYEPMTAFAYWAVVMAVWTRGRSLRQMVRPAGAALLVFLLILGNLVQLQSGLGNGLEITGKMSASMAQLTRLRTPSTWVSAWASQEIWSYLFLFVSAAWALAILWKHLDTLTRWIVIGLASSGLVSVAVAAFLLATRLQVATAMPPSRNLAFTVAMSVLLCGAVACHLLVNRSWLAALAPLALVIASLLNAQILDLLHLERAIQPAEPETADLRAAALWARGTWGSSMFQFPDAAKDISPGEFRALSFRALWADWESGLIADSSDLGGRQWWLRWQQTMSGPYSTDRLKAMLSSPIDYYVLKQEHRLAAIKPVYSNSTYVIYDAQDLRDAPGIHLQNMSASPPTAPTN